MNAELLDQDGYPTEAALDIIRGWKVDRPFSELMAFIEPLWYGLDRHWRQVQEPHEIWTDRMVRRWYISTGGWSGNESIIDAMRETAFLWTLNWVQSRRGGHYIFEEYPLSSA